MASNFLVQLSPLPQVKGWCHSGGTGDTDSAIFVAIAFGAIQWCFYGLFAYWLMGEDNFLILLNSNVLGVGFGAYYMSAFHRLCRSDKARDSFYHYLSAVFALIVLQVCVICVLPYENSLFITGIIAAFCSVIGGVSLLTPVPAVISSKDSRSLSWPICIANFASGFLWCLCGYLLEDNMIVGPNLVTGVASAICIHVKLMYPAIVQKEDWAAQTFEEFWDSLDDKALRKNGELTPLGALKFQMFAPAFNDMKFLKGGNYSTCELLSDCGVEVLASKKLSPSSKIPFCMDKCATTPSCFKVEQELKLPRVAWGLRADGTGGTY